MSDNENPSKSTEENNTLNRPGTSTNATEEIISGDTKCPSNAVSYKKNLRIGKQDKQTAHSSNYDQEQSNQDEAQKAEDLIDTIATDTFEELITRCEKCNKEKQISVLFPTQFNSMSSSVRTLKQSQSCFSNSALRCFLLQSMSHPSRISVTADKKWSPVPRARYSSPKTDATTQSTPPEPETAENATLIYSRDGIAEMASAEVQISPSLIPPRPIVGEPPLEGAPPSYSAVMRIGPTRASPRRLFGRRVDTLEPSPPFITPTPPPTYAEAQGHYYRPVLVDSDLLWGPDPMPAACQRCGTYIITQTTNQRSNMTHFAALALCICGCWPCCLLPYCMNSCKNTYHYCPNCNTYLGMYRPWN